MKAIVFYNHFHNGDLHVSRQLVNKLLQKLGDKYDYYYTHGNHGSILKDLPVKFDKHLIKHTEREGGNFIYDERLYVNTWYGANGLKYLKTYGTSFNCVYHLFDDLCKEYFDFTIEDLGTPRELCPIIDYSKYEIKKIDQYISKSKRKKVLVCNNLVKSGQANNFNMIKAIKELASWRKDVDFIITDKEEGIKIDGSDNIIYSPEIIGKKRPDLNENSYISTFCDLIIGRFSGPYTFSLVQDNLFRNVKFICFVKNVSNGDYIWYKKPFKMDADVIGSTKISKGEVKEVIKKELKEL